MRTALLAIGLGALVGWAYDNRNELMTIRGIKLIHEQQVHGEPRLTDDEFYFRLTRVRLDGGDL